MDKWRIIHDYRRAVENDKLPPLLCPDDEVPLFVVSNRLVEPAFKCMVCKSVFIPGLNVWDSIIKSLKELN